MKKIFIVFLCIIPAILCSCGQKNVTSQPEKTDVAQNGTSITQSSAIVSSNDTEIKENYGEIEAKKLSLSENIYIFDVSSKLSWRGYKSLEYILQERPDLTPEQRKVTGKDECKDFVVAMDFEKWEETTLPTKSMPKAYIYFENNDVQINMEVLFGGKAYASLNTADKTVYYEIPLEVYNSIVANQ